MAHYPRHLTQEQRIEELLDPQYMRKGREDNRNKRLAAREEAKRIADAPPVADVQLAEIEPATQNDIVARSPLDNPVVNQIKEQKKKLLEQEIEKTGVYIPPTEDEVKNLNSDFNNDSHFKELRKKKFNKNLENYNLAIKSGDNTKAQQWTNYDNSLKKRNTYYEDVFKCTMEGTCENDSFDLIKNTETNWRYDDQINNVPLLKSIQRTEGAYKEDGTLKTNKELINSFMSNQAYNMSNIVAMGFEAAKLYNATDQEKSDAALQLISYDKIRATGDGSRDWLNQTKDVAWGIITDPSTYLLGSGFAAKEAAKKLTKEGVKSYLKQLIKSNTGKLGVKEITKKSAIFGAGYAGFDNLARQKIKISAELQDEVSWSEFGINTTLGATIGGSLGFLIGGSVTAFNNAADRYMIKAGISNKEFLSELRDNVKSEDELYRWLKNIGWSKEEARRELLVLEEQGLKFNADKGHWVSKEGIEYKPSLHEKISEQSKFGEEVGNRIVPKPLARKAEEKLDEDFIDVFNIDLQIPFSRIGQRAFDWFDNALGATAVRTMYGGDAIMVRSGLRKEATAIKDAMASIDINVSRISHELNEKVAKNVNSIGDINKLIRSRKPTNPTQREFLKLLDSRKNEQLRTAWKNKVISTEEFTKFMKDPTYIPRVWNSQRLLTDKGAGEFSDFITKLYKKDPKAAHKIISNITGKKADADAVINSNFAPNRIRTMFRNKADKEIDVHRSSHLEHERKLAIPAKYEQMLDPFMAQPLDRWSKFFDDVIKRNEFARRFGANDKKIHQKIKSLQKQGKNKQADHLREYYFTNMGDPRYSDTVKAKMQNPTLMKGISKINAFQNLKLGMAAIPNATQAFVNGTTMLAKSGSILTAPFKAISAIVRANVKTTRDMDIVHRAGVLGETDLARIATENMQHSRIIEKEFRGGLQYLNEPTKFLRAVGFLGVEEMNRRSASIMAHGHVSSLHSKLQKLLMTGKADTNKSRKLQRELKEMGINDPLKKDLTSRDYAISGHMFNKHVNFSGETFNIPTNWQTPWFKLFTKFKSFMFYQARFLKRNVTDELFLHHNPKPLMAYLASAGIAGNAAEMTRALATGKEIDNNRDALELLIAGIGNAGGSGLWWDTMQQVAERGPGGAWSSVMGPTFSDIAYTAQDLSKGDLEKIVGRMLPNIPGKHQLIQQWRDQ